MAGVLDGKVVIVTGGARGLGRVYSLGIAAEGGRVVIADVLDGRPVADEISQLGGKAFAVTTDVSDEQATRDMAAAEGRHLAHLGRGRQAAVRGDGRAQ